MKSLTLTGLCAFAVLSATITLDAALPPLYQTTAEIERVLKGVVLGHLLPDGDPILEIRKNELGYEIITLNHSLQAKIIYKPQNQPGPAQFEVEFEEPGSLK